MKTIQSIVLLLMFLTSVASATVIDCNNCTDCNEKIQNTSIGDVIRLTADITDHEGTCINFADKDGITFDGMGYTIDGDGDYNGYGVYLPSYSNNNVVKNCTVTGFLNGIYIYESSYNVIKDIDSIDNMNYGVYVRYSPYNIFSNLTLRGSVPPGAGIFFDISSNNVLNNSYVVDNYQYGLNIRSSEYLTIYNNYFDNNRVENSYFSGTIYPATWNITATPETNIIGGSSIGGNYWDEYIGSDADGDGFGDVAYNVQGAGDLNVDYLPLIIPMCGDVDCNGYVSANDVVETYRRAVNPNYPLANEWGADVDGNGYVSANDVVEIYRAAVDPNHLLNCITIT